MARDTLISWTDATWNPWQGCTKVSAACRDCYMMRDKRRYGQDGTIVVRSAAPTFNLPLAKGQRRIPEGSTVFTCSWSDWFHEVADPWRDEAWAIIRQRPDLLFLVLTKRPERIRDHLPADWGSGYPNVALGVTWEDASTESRVIKLRELPARFRFVSIEPMLAELDVAPHLRPAWGEARLVPGHGMLRPHLTGLDWVIVGGESGSEARPLPAAWVRKVRDACAEVATAGVRFHFKQWGEWIPLGQQDPAMKMRRTRLCVTAEEQMMRYGVDDTGALLDGVHHRDRLPWPPPGELPGFYDGVLGRSYDADEGDGPPLRSGPRDVPQDTRNAFDRWDGALGENATPELLRDEFGVSIEEGAWLVQRAAELRAEGLEPAAITGRLFAESQQLHRPEVAT